MDISSEEHVSVDRLADGSYIVTRKDHNTYVAISESYATEGQMMGAVLKAIMPTRDVSSSNLRDGVAAIASASLDKAIEDWKKEH